VPNSQPKVFAMNECDWVAAFDLESAKQCYAEWLNYDSVASAEADAMYDDPAELSEADMQRIQFTHDRDDPGECEAYGHTECSFADRLKEMIAEGQTFPSFFASTEY